ncbi:MAG: alpha/beta hydrolase [Acidimicrobiia bacterium]|nr:alpha/beta hydrolase [bacterium]MXW59629.1 alpha/beta hydrolase [Acidimicrobiia bacterium]MYB73091.1 alpha/beta hydrolase [Acidimicrobiia bacterium]MYI00020.1 alpha/beta hydrolase [Acidimicrobiia bacterium]
MKLWDETIDGYRPEARAMLAALAEAFPAAGGDLPDDPVARAQIQRQNMIDFEPEPSPMAVESTIPGPGGDIPVRLFEPEEPRAMFLHIHGGGWIIGRPQMSDPANEHLATRHGLAVLSVDYRLAPEHPYPAGPDDCEAAAAWMLEHGPERWGTDKMFIGGESAGGHLAAATLLRVRDRLGAIDRVLGANLVFGWYDLRGTPSIFDNGGNPDILDPEGLQIMIDSFTPGMTEAERRDPDVSPLFANLSGLPPCLVTVGANDHLADDSYFLAARMAAAESPVELAVYPDSPHGFQVFPSQMTKTHAKRFDAWIASLMP